MRQWVLAGSLWRGFALLELGAASLCWSTRRGFALLELGGRPKLHSVQMRISLRYASVNTDSETDSGDRYYPPTAGRAGPRQCQTPVKAPHEVSGKTRRKSKTSGSQGKKTSGTYRTQSEGGRKRASGRRKPTQLAVMRRQVAKEQREVEKMERFEQEFCDGIGRGIDIPRRSAALRRQRADGLSCRHF